MKNKAESTYVSKKEDAKTLACRLMHMHYCEDDAEGVAAYFAPEFTWFGAGESQYVYGQKAAVDMFCQFKGAIPKCSIDKEEYDVIEPAEGIYIVTGRMWISTSQDVEMYLKVHQRVTFVFKDTENGLLCAHIHCSNPYQEMADDEMFPEKIGRQSYNYVQERLAELEEKTLQQNRQMEVVLSSIAGGLKISNDDDTYSFAYVSREAAGLFGYTQKEFMEATGGSAVGAVYPPDLEQALADCAEAFKNGGLSYSTRYRIKCKDGSLKWIIDSGKKAQDAEGRWMVNSLYLDITKAEEDAQRLREQTQLLASIYDTVSCGIVRFKRRRDNEYELISINKAALSILGYEKQEEAVLDWQNGVVGAILESDRQQLRNLYGTLNEIGDRKDRQYRVRWKDGSIRWLDGTNMVVDKTDNGEIFIQRTLVDVTERKALQQRLEQEQEMYRVAMESSSDTMFEYIKDTDTFISYEPQVGNGIIRRELENYSVLLRDSNFVHPDDSQKALKNICGGNDDIFEVRVVTPYTLPGEYRWHRISCRLIEHEGWPSRVVGTARNIHNMKETLSENSERLHMSQAALQAISDIYTSILYINLTEDQYYAVRLPKGLETKGISRTGCFSDTLVNVQLPHVKKEDRKTVADLCSRESLINSVSNIRGHEEFEFRMNGSDSKNIWMRMEIHPVTMDNEDTKAVILTIRNITGEKEKDLERFMEEKAAKHALEEAYEGARRANLAKSEFLSRMSHDIRTPMNAIMGMSAIAEKQLNDRDKVSDCLSKIRISGNHLLGLINEVLDMSKIESGNVNLSENKFLLGNMLNTVEQIIRPDVDYRNINFKFNYHFNNDMVIGDSMRVQQVLINLLSNAVKYSNIGGNVSLTAEEKLSGKKGVGCFEFIVEDDGIGMTSEFRQKMFAPFERADDPRVSKIQGTGLGLSIAYNLVQMMNGTIMVESEPEKGSRFIVTIYLKLAEKEKPDKTQDEEQFQKAEFDSSTHILLVEDNDINREIAGELLSMAGMRVSSAADGRQAVELFESNQPGTYSLILMDIQMPVMDGYEATRAIRDMGLSGGRKDALEIPIIALTANAFADDIYRAKQAGMNEHVSKPLEINHLLKTIRRWLD